MKNGNRDGKTGNGSDSNREQTTAQVSESKGRFVYEKLILSVEKGPDQGKTATWQKGRSVKIGRIDECDFRLDDPRISRVHIALEPRPNGFLLKDLDSKNGTFVRKMAIKEILLDSECEIKIGGSILKFSIVKEEIDLDAPPSARIEGLIGDSPPMRRLTRAIEAYAPLESHVLISGETGTGKELVAQGLHQLSGRRGEFVRFSGAVAPSSTFESELFGHVRGAYTGAEYERLGAFREADGGTIFLDEIHRVPPDLQPRLLHALDNQEVKPLGSDRWVKASVRVVAATNKDLSDLVEKGAFQADLFYRLCVLPMHVPPLREHLGDVPALVDHFLREGGGIPPRLTEEAMNVLLAQRWSGNVRELKNIVMRCRALSPSGSMEARVVEQALRAYPSPGEKAPGSPTGDGTLLEVEKRRILEALEQAGGNKRKAAKILGISETALHAKLNRYGLR